MPFGLPSLAGLGAPSFGVFGVSGQFDVRLVGSAVQLVALSDFSLPLAGTAGLGLLALLLMAHRSRTGRAGVPAAPDRSG